MTVSPLDLHKCSSRAYRATLAGVPPCAGEYRHVRGFPVGTPPEAAGLWDFCGGKDWQFKLFSDHSTRQTMPTLASFRGPVAHTGSFDPCPGLFRLSHHRSFGIWMGPSRSGRTARRGEVPGPQHPRPPGRPGGMMVLCVPGNGAVAVARRRTVGPVRVDTARRSERDELAQLQRGRL